MQNGPYKSELKIAGKGENKFPGDAVPSVDLFSHSRFVAVGKDVLADGGSLSASIFSRAFSAELVTWLLGRGAAVGAGGDPALKEPTLLRAGCA